MMFPPFDPITFWMRGTVVWARVWQTQNEAWLRYVAAFAGRVPQESSADLAAEAEALRAPDARKPAAPARRAATGAHKAANAPKAQATLADA